MSRLFKDSIEYADHSEIVENGIPHNGEIIYLGVHYANGIINYVQIYHTVMIQRYTSKEEWESMDMEKINAEHLRSSDYAEGPDDIIFFAETDNELWVFWNDRSGKCSIGRVDKSRMDRDTFKDEYMQNVLSDDRYDGKYVDLPVPTTGWIKL